VRSELASGRVALLDVVGLPVRRQWYLVRRSTRRLVPAAEEFGAFLLSEAEGLLNAPGNLLEMIPVAKEPRARIKRGRGRREKATQAARPR